MVKMADVMQKCLSVMPTHQQFIDRNCKAENHEKGSPNGAT